MPNTMFKRKLEVIEARQITGHTPNDHDVYLWVEKHIGSFNPLEPFPDQGISIDPNSGYIFLATKTKVHVVNLFDWIIRNSDGEFSVCQPKTFDALYEPYSVREQHDYSTK